MDILSEITQKISALPAGALWEISARSLLLSRADFQSLHVFLTKEAEKGGFSVQTHTCSAALYDTPALQLIKH